MALLRRAAGAFLGDERQQHVRRDGRGGRAAGADDGADGRAIAAEHAGVQFGRSVPFLQELHVADDGELHRAVGGRAERQAWQGDGAKGGGDRPDEDVIMSRVQFVF